MHDLAIQVVELGKQYHIGSNHARANTLRDMISGVGRNAVRWAGRHRDSKTLDEHNPKNTIWALKDVSFEVQQGEVLGVVGHNGAGKSTLLRLLSFVTEPTAGHVRVRGRVGSLLEIGTGFHSELTGRENIYLSGAILGMKKAETDRKFDEIVDFAGVEQFIDTPIKHYSTGMYMRLGFAVASHLDSEILLVDEVLAVGDADFQKKCIRSMQSIAGRGQTVLVVSHNMAVIESLCKTAIWIDRGRLQASGATSEVISTYLTQSESIGELSLIDRPRQNPNTSARFVNIQMLDDAGKDTRKLTVGTGITVKLDIETLQPIRRPCVAIQIRSQHNQLLCHVANREAGYTLPPMDGNGTVHCHIENLNLLPGRYFVNLILSDMSNTIYDEIPTATSFDVTPADVLGSGIPMGKEHGIMFFPTRWEVT